MRIGEILAAKPSSGVVTIGREASVRDLLAVLAEHNIGACVVSDDGQGLDGIVSERDVVRRLHADPAVLDQPVGEIMTSQVSTCATDDTLDQVMAQMTEGRFRHLPVVTDGALVGVISIGDLVKHRIEELRFERDQLESYVHQV